MKKLSLIALAVATALVGCGSDDSPSNNDNNDNNGKPEIAVPAQGQFIDAAVEGLYYTSGDKQGVTNAQGQYEVDANADQVIFTLGGKEGLVIGSVSARHTTTPFEAAGSYQRSVNLARLLLTIDVLQNNNSSISIPEAIKAPTPEMITALQRITLDDIETSSAKLLELLGKKPSDLVSAEQAAGHLQQSLEGLERGSKDTLSDWARGSNKVFVQRFAQQRIKDKSASDYDLVIHADRTLGDPVFLKTVGLSAMTFTLQKDQFITHAGSNDGSLSGSHAAKYLTCVNIDGEVTFPDDNTVLCNGDDIEVDPRLSDVANGYGSYQLVVTNPTKISKEDESTPWEGEKGIAEMGGPFECMANANCSEQALTKFEVITRDDSDKQDGSAMQKETTSGSYDPITGVYIESYRKEYLSEPNLGRVSEYITFLYPVDAVGQDRYVDFIGTWRSVQTQPNCDLVAIAQYTFDENGLTATGNELNSNDGQCYLKPFEYEPVSYAELAKMDYWWFTTNTAGASKATLDQLNTTIRWNDIDLSQGETGENYKINRFSYIPAGKNWDRGTLVRDTLDTRGNKVHTVTLTKI